MNWYALVEGRLGFIGRFDDWDAANERVVALGLPEWSWLASQDDVDQWVECITKTERGS